MRYNLFSTFAILVSLLFFTQATYATTTETPEVAKVVIVYTSQDAVTPPDVTKLETLVSRFSKNIVSIRDRDLTSNALSNVTHILIYNQTNNFDADAEKLINESALPVYGLGRGVTTIKPFSSLQFKRLQAVSSYKQTRTNQDVQFERSESVVVTMNKDKVKPIATTLSSNELPVVFSYGKHHFSGLSTLMNRSYLLVADSLFEFFNEEAMNQHVGYLRLEDISPASDPVLLEETGTYLLNRDIPILLTVIPIYVDSTNGNLIRFTDRPKLLSVLNRLEDLGATVLLHGYTHQYRSSETGEGFEFWDVENNQPIFDPADEKTSRLKTEEAFSSQAIYESYQKDLNARETEYITGKINNGISELVSLGLHPLGFEAPHYAMSHLGYKVTSKYSSNIFGQVQWSENQWDVMNSVPFITKPPFMDGLTLYPETIGYVDTSLDQPIETVKRSRDEMLLVRESVIGGFYHPYLGMRYIEELVDMMESTPNFTWLSLRQTGEKVTTSEIMIQTDSNGEVVLQDKRSSLMLWFSQIAPNSFLERALYALALITLIAVSAFSFYTLYLRTQRKKRLFKERIPHG